MKRLLIIFCVLAIFATFVTSGTLRASEPKVKVMFIDTLYGAAIGSAIAGIVILNNNDDWGKKLTLGVTLGAIGGLAFGVIEGFGMLSQNDPLSIPTRPLLAFKRLPDGKFDTTIHLDLVSVYF